VQAQGEKGYVQERVEWESCPGCQPSTTISNSAIVHPSLRSMPLPAAADAKDKATKIPHPKIQSHADNPQHRTSQDPSAGSPSNPLPVPHLLPHPQIPLQSRRAALTPYQKDGGAKTNENDSTARRVVM